MAKTIIIGAGPAGLAVAASLKQLGHDAILLERTEHIGAAWHKHYDRLHLHTPKGSSALPYLPFPKSYPRYISREQFVTYLETYVQHFELKPELGQDVQRAYVEDGLWQVETTAQRYSSDFLVVATGNTRTPRRPHWEGLERFTGDALHSSEYKNGSTLKGKKVLVVGFGNSGGEIALDLFEHGAMPFISVRSPVNVIPRDLFGIPIVSIAIAVSKLPPRLSDTLTAPVLSLIYGNVGKLGFQKQGYGSLEQIKQTSRIPFIDIGTMAHIRAGDISVRPAIRSFGDRDVTFADGQKEAVDAVVLATGYCPAITSFLETPFDSLDEMGRPRQSGVQLAKGLFYCGYYVAATGMLREIAIEAKRIAKSIGQQS